jgi:outer membrane protein, adhesin transport system
LIQFLFRTAACVFVSVAAHAQTLEQAVTQALSTFPEVRSATASRRALAETLDQARAQGLPSVDATLGAGPQRSDNPVSRTAPGGPQTLTRREVELNVAQLLYDGGGVATLVRRQEARLESASQQVATTAESVGLRVSQAFLEVLRLRSLLAVAQDNVASHRRTLEQVDIIVESGAGRRADSRQAAARLSLAESSLVQLRGQLAQAESNYRHLTGRDPATLLRRPEPESAVPASVRAAVDDALARHPSVKSAEQELEAAIAELESARSRLGPRVTLELGLSHDRDLNGIRGLNADQTLMVRLRQNLYRGGADVARIREAEARVSEAHALLARARNDVERDVRQAWDNLTAERERLPQSRLHARAAAEVAEAYRAQFRIGQRSLLDVLNAESEYFNARSTELSGELGVAAGIYRLLASQARLLSTLGVPVPSPDAADEAVTR